MNYNFQSITVPERGIFSRDNERATNRMRNANYMRYKTQAMNDIAKGIRDAGMSIAQGFRDEENKKKEWERLLEEQKRYEYEKSRQEKLDARQAEIDKQNDLLFNQKQEALANEQKKNEAIQSGISNFENSNNAGFNRTKALGDRISKLEEELNQTTDYGAMKEMEALGERPTQAGAEQDDWDSKYDALNSTLSGEDYTDKLNEVNDAYKEQENVGKFDFVNDKAYQLALAAAKASNSYEPLQNYMEGLKQDTRYEDERDYSRGRDAAQFALNKSQVDLAQKQAQDTAEKANQEAELEKMAKQYGQVADGFETRIMSPMDLKALKNDKQELLNRINQLNNIYYWASMNGNELLKNRVAEMLGQYNGWYNPLPAAAPQR